jgi:hypothetical protein
LADVTKDVAQSHQEAPHQTGFSAKAPKRKLKAWQKDVQSVATKFISYEDALKRKEEK